MGTYSPVLKFTATGHWDALVSTSQCPQNENFGTVYVSMSHKNENFGDCTSQCPKNEKFRASTSQFTTAEPGQKPVEAQGRASQRRHQTPNHSFDSVQAIRLRSHVLRIESPPLGRRPELPSPIPGGKHSHAAHAPTTLKTRSRHSIPTPLHGVSSLHRLQALATHNLNSRHAPAHALTGAHSRFVRSPCCCIANRHNALILAVRAAHCFPRNTLPNNEQSVSVQRIERFERVIVKRWIIPSPGNLEIVVFGNA